PAGRVPAGAAPHEVVECHLWLRRSSVLKSMAQLRSCRTGKHSILGAECIEVLLLELFQIEEGVMRAFGCADELVELHLDRFSVSILCVLNQKDHQERDDRGAGVDHQLPGVTEAEYGP